MKITTTAIAAPGDGGRCLRFVDGNDGGAHVTGGHSLSDIDVGSSTCRSSRCRGLDRIDPLVPGRSGLDARDVEPGLGYWARRRPTAERAVTRHRDHDLVSRRPCGRQVPHHHLPCAWRQAGRRPGGLVRRRQQGTLSRGIRRTLQCRHRRPAHRRADRGEGQRVSPIHPPRRQGAAARPHRRQRSSRKARADRPDG